MTSDMNVFGAPTRYKSVNRYAAIEVIFRGDMSSGGEQGFIWSAPLKTASGWSECGNIIFNCTHNLSGLILERQ